MRTRFVLIAAVFGLLLLPAAAFAYAPTGDDFITCTPEEAEPGDTVECEGGLFDPGTEVDVLVTASTLLDTTLTADSDGTVSFSFDIPADHEDGAYTVRLSGTRDGEPNTIEEQAGTIETADDGEGAIAETGADAGLLALGALGAVALGGGALWTTRRKDRQPVS